MDHATPSTPQATRLLSCALAPVSSLFGEGVSVCPSPCSWLIALSSPSAKGQRPGFALRSSLVTHNQMVITHEQTEQDTAIQPALQAGARPIDDSRFFARGLLDGLPRSQTCQIWLSDASRGIPTAPLLVHVPVMHNSFVSINSRQNRPAALRETGCSGTRTELRQTCCGVYSSSAVGCRRSGRNEVESLDRACYTPIQKTRGLQTTLAQYTHPSFSAPIEQLPCQDQPTARATTTQCLPIPRFLLSTKLVKNGQGAEQVTRSPLNALSNTNPLSALSQRIVCYEHLAYVTRRHCYESSTQHEVLI